MKVLKTIRGIDRTVRAYSQGGNFKEQGTYFKVRDATHTHCLKHIVDQKSRSCAAQLYVYPSRRESIKKIIYIDITMDTNV